MSELKQRGVADEGGPSERAGFVEAPELGPPEMASRPTVPPVAIAAALLL